MQTTPRSARTSAPTQFSATFENQASGTIYNTKYMFAIGKKLRMWNCFTMENPLHTKSHISHTVSTNHNVLKSRLLSITHKVMIQLLIYNADNSTSRENINTFAVFSYLWKPSFWHHLQHEVHVTYGEEKHNALKCSLLSVPHKVRSSCSFEMQTTPRSAGTSAPTQFSATFENAASGTIYNTKYMLAIGNKNTMRWKLHWCWCSRWMWSCLHFKGAARSLLCAEYSISCISAHCVFLPYR